MPITTPSSAPQPALQLLIGGEWVESVSGLTFANLDPRTGAKLCDVAEATPEDVDRAVMAAKKVAAMIETKNNCISIDLNTSLRLEHVGREASTSYDADNMFFTCRVLELSSKAV